MPADVSPSIARRLIASLVDAFILLLVPILWWHWSEWARYTSTFGRQLPATVAMPLMALMPLTVLWLEGVTGRSLGKKLTGLRLRNTDGSRLSLSRSFVRSTLKWSPAWIGPAVWIIDACTDGTRADDFTNDYLLAFTNDWADRLPPAGMKLIWVVNVSLRGMNWGVIALAIVAVGYLLVLLPGRRTLLDYLCHTRVSR